VLHGIDLDVATSQVACVIGGNGAGKTTLLMTICGRVPAWSGTILFEGEDITRVPTYELPKRGIALVPEGRRIFPRMSVLDNLQLGAFSGDPGAFRNRSRFRAEPVSRAQGAAAPIRRHAFWRRAADARDSGAR
jgi:ABC-type branched-subunit amino acid transport system ATPase component